MKVLVTGAGGQLGRAVRKAASGREFDCIFTDVVSGDDIVAKQPGMREQYFCIYRQIMCSEVRRIRLIRRMTFLCL